MYQLNPSSRLSVAPCGALETTSAYTPWITDKLGDSKYSRTSDRARLTDSPVHVPVSGWLRPSNRPSRDPAMPLTSTGTPLSSTAP